MQNTHLQAIQSCNFFRQEIPIFILSAGLQYCKKLRMFHGLYLKLATENYKAHKKDCTWYLVKICGFAHKPWLRANSFTNSIFKENTHY